MRVLECCERMTYPLNLNKNQMINNESAVTCSLE